MPPQQTLPPVSKRRARQYPGRGATKKQVLAPFTPSRSTRSGRPITVLLDPLGRRWALRVLDDERGYAVTEHGSELAAALEPLQH